MLQVAICLSLEQRSSQAIFWGVGGDFCWFFVVSKNVRTGSVVTVSFNCFHSFSCRAVQLNTVLCCSNSLRHAVLEVRLRMNFPRKLIIPMALKTPFCHWGQAYPIWLTLLTGQVPPLHLWPCLPRSSSLWLQRGTCLYSVLVHSFWLSVRVSPVFHLVVVLPQTTRSSI